MTQEATIRRGVRNARYAAIPNHVFEDARLSMEARWLLCYLLSKPDNWTVVIGDIVKRGNCGRDKARKMIAELVATGYAEREQQRDEGKFGASVLVIFDEPSSMNAQQNQAIAESVAFLPQTDLPSTAIPSPVKSAHSNNLDLENTDCYPERERERDVGDEEGSPKAVERDFKRFFIGWGTAISDSEPDARREWLALKPEERIAAQEGSVAYQSIALSTGRKYLCSAAKYLKERRWEKLPAMEAKAVTAAPVMGGKLEAPIFGPLWATARFLPILAGPQMVETSDRETVRRSYDMLAKSTPAGAARYAQRKGISISADGDLVFPDDFEQREWERTILTSGYPEANRLHEAARSRERAAVDAAYDLAKHLTEAVKVGSAVWVEWREWHERENVPFVPDPRSFPVVYFPKGGPAGLKEFETAARAAMQGKQGDGDAA